MEFETVTTPAPTKWERFSEHFFNFLASYVLVGISGIVGWAAASVDEAGVIIFLVILALLILFLAGLYARLCIRRA